MTVRVVSSGPAQTHALGLAVAGLLRPGDVVLLSGDLGAGKTQLAKGIAAGLGVTEPVVSPTFAILREYEGALPVFHLDVYRLDHVQEAVDLALDETFDLGVTLVEWGEGIRELLPADRLEISLEYRPPDAAADDERIVAVTPVGPGWRDRAAALTAAVEAGTRC
jgi:tRNA threonylcarbamoyladenosine biosynthesis protein TsaE